MGTRAAVWAMESGVSQEPVGQRAQLMGDGLGFWEGGQEWH